MIPPSPILTPQSEPNPNLDHLVPISPDLLDLQEQLNLILQTIQSLRVLQSILNYQPQNEENFRLHWDLVHLQEALQPALLDNLQCLLLRFLSQQYILVREMTELSRIS